MRVTAQVVHQLARTRERRLRIHHPGPLAALPQPVAAMRRVAQPDQRRRQIQPALGQQPRHPVQILAAKHLAQPMHWKQELAAPGDPPRPVRRQRARRHQAVQMEMTPQPLVPRVQHERESHLAEVLAAKRQQGFGRRVEQRVQQKATAVSHSLVRIRPFKSCGKVGWKRGMEKGISPIMRKNVGGILDLSPVPAAPFLPRSTPGGTVTIIPPLFHRFAGHDDPKNRQRGEDGDGLRDAFVHFGAQSFEVEASRSPSDEIGWVERRGSKDSGVSKRQRQRTRILLAERPG